MHKEPEGKGEAEDRIWGVNPVLELLRLQPARVIEVTVLRRRPDARIAEIIGLCRQHGVKLRQGTGRPGLDRQEAHQGVVAAVSPFAYLPLDDLLAQVAGRPEAVLVLLDGIEDPRNLGAVIRAAAAAGADGLILTKDRAAPLSAAAVKASAGLAARLPVCRVTNLGQAMTRLKEAGFWLHGTAADAPASLYQTDLAGRIGLVVGSEGRGIRPGVRRHLDGLVAIPMAAGVESLNVAVAAAVVLFEIRRRHLAAATAASCPRSCP
ncbi:MAG: 23S rRNA (guanosine(2251)-2'-O)-methyltransferase RlmB [Thermodesulfobacteriota bacterium]